MMIFISVFMVTIKLEIQAVCELGVSFLSYVVHIDGRPFIDSDLNQAEKNALISATFTLYAGLYYLSGLGSWASFCLYLLIVLVNCLFGASWLKGFLREQLGALSKSPFGQKILKKVPFLARFANFDATNFNAKSPVTLSQTPEVFPFFRYFPFFF